MSRTILLVEDTDVCTETLEMALTRVAGVVIQSVQSAEAALDFLARNPVCAMITDLHLPEMDGFDLIERVRKNPARADVPILVISGDSDPATPARLAKLGANAFFPKPYSPAEVRGKLKQLIDAP
jgi:DNA-binding response OmpR family regulator